MLPISYENDVSTIRGMFIAQVEFLFETYFSIIVFAWVNKMIKRYTTLEWKSKQKQKTKTKQKHFS